MLVIHASVGAEAPNHVADVRAVQAALNAVPTNEGGPTEPLTVDGRCGPRTIAAIARFQLDRFGWTDFRIDPGMGTARLLAAGATGRIVAGQAVPLRARGAVFRQATTGGAGEMWQVTQQVPVVDLAGTGVMEAFSGNVSVNGRPPVPGQRLQRGDRVSTLEGGSARFVLYFGTSRHGDKTEVVMGENALVVMIGREPDVMNGGAAAPVRTTGGRLRDALHRLAGGG